MAKWDFSWSKKDSTNSWLHLVASGDLECFDFSVFFVVFLRLKQVPSLGEC